MSQKPALSPDIRALQEDTINLLGDVAKLMEKASKVLKDDASGCECAEFQREVEQSAQNVRNLELVMSIVAPMKAGKSTIINAIVGQDVLPSRNAAMTALPTEIKLDRSFSEPVLTFKPETIALVRKTFEELRAYVDRKGQKLAEDMLAKQPSATELTELLNRILNSACSTLEQQQTQGQASIKQALSDLNDLVRLAGILIPEWDLQNQLDEVPRIETAYAHGETDEALGNLVIVDTPGPNESGEGLRLSLAVERQLKRSSIVLIVLDFTQLNSQAADTVKKQVAPIVDLLGYDNLYVLVNKVDQRSEGDMTSEQVQNFVVSDLELKGEEISERVFEVAARWAFCATNFQWEVSQNPDATIQELQTSQALAQQAFGASWKRKIKHTDIEELQEEAQYLWEDSGFSDFLENAVLALMESAAPRAIQTAIAPTQQRMKMFRDEILIRQGSLFGETSRKIEEQLKSLEEDLKHLESCRRRIKQVNQIKNQLLSDIEMMLENAKEVTRVNVNSYFKKEDYDKSNFIQQIDIKVRNFLLRDIGDLSLFPASISKVIHQNLEYQPSGEFEFSNKLEAEEFKNGAFSWAKERSDIYFSALRSEIDSRFTKAHQALAEFIDRETRPLIRKAQKRLNEAFNLEIEEFQAPDIESFTVNSDNIKIESKSKTVKYKTTEEYRPWYYLWVFKVKRTVSKSRRENYYIVSLNELVSEFNDALEYGFQKISRTVESYIDNDLKQQIDIYFNQLDAYLNRYRDSLRKAAEDKRLSAEKKKDLEKQLSKLSEEVDEQLKKLDCCMKRVSSCLK